MAKKVKFPLDMGNEAYVRTLEELKENYNSEKVTEYFLDGRLLTWLNDRYFDDEAEQVQELTEQGDKDNLAAKLGKIFGVEIESEEIDIEALEIRREKLDKLRRITSDDKILENVDSVAFSQEEIGDLLDEGKEVIYLCGDKFRIPLSVEDVRYIGVNKPVISIGGKGKIDLEASGIVIAECDFSEDTKSRIKADKPAGKIQSVNMKGFKTKKTDGLLCLTEYTGNDKYVEIPYGIEVISTAFEENEDIETVIIPNSVVTIGDSAFSYCENLKSVEIPNSVVTIGNSAFSDCENLESIEIPDSVVTIGDSAFKGCKNIETVNIHAGVETIGNYAFSDCENLKSIEIPDSVVTIGYSAFEDCKNIETVNIPAGVERIGFSSFAGCTSLTEISVDPNNMKYRSLDGVLFNHDLSVLIQCPAGVNGNYIIPDSVEEIDYSAFCKCSNLESIEIPDSVVTIGDSAFSDCENLESIDIPDSVETIGDSAFSNCSNLENVTLSENLTEIASGLFSGCSNLESVEIPNSVVTICEEAFDYCGLKSIDIPDSVETIEKRAFTNCGNLENVTLSENLTEISGWLFMNCSRLESIEIPYKVSKICWGAFAGCKKLKDVSLSNGLSKIEQGVFNNCVSLRNITIPSNTDIGLASSLFRDCTKVTVMYKGSSYTHYNLNILDEVIALKNDRIYV